MADIDAGLWIEADGPIQSSPLTITTEHQQMVVDCATTAERYRRRWEAHRDRFGYRAGLALKRAMDVGVSAGLLLVLSPLLLVLAVAVKLSSPGPILFGQRRVGRGGRTVRVLKLRSMRCDAEEVLRRHPELREEYLANGFTLHLDRDPRVTRVGRLLRRTSLDELPQLWNVLRGEMSIIGPRPILDSELELYGEVDWAYLAVRPGMTGMWQVSGRNSIPYPERAWIDARYVADWSVWRDLVIFLKTPVAVLRGSNPEVDQATLEGLAHPD